MKEITFDYNPDSSSPWFVIDENGEVIDMGNNMCELCKKYRRCDHNGKGDCHMLPPQ